MRARRALQLSTVSRFPGLKIAASTDDHGVTPKNEKPTNADIASTPVNTAHSAATPTPSLVHSLASSIDSIFGHHALIFFSVPDKQFSQI